MPAIDPRGRPRPLERELAAVERCVVSALAFVLVTLAGTAHAQTVRPASSTLDASYAQGRLSVEVAVAGGATLLLAALGGVAGGASGVAACGAETVLSDCGLAGIAIGAIALPLATVPALVTAVGSELRGRGHLAGAYLGALVGLVPGAVLFGIASAVDEGENVQLHVTSFIVSLVFPMIGAPVGYELWDDLERARDAAPLALVPWLDVTRDRVAIGVQGAL